MVSVHPYRVVDALDSTQGSHFSRRVTWEADGISLGTGEFYQMRKLRQLNPVKSLIIRNRYFLMFQSGDEYNLEILIQ